MLKASLAIDSAAGTRLQEIAAMLTRPVALYKDTGRRLANDLRKHFAELDAQQSPKHAGLSTHFWLDVRNATQNPDVDPQGASVSIAHPAFAMKYYGGTITAKNGRALTIPIHPLAHGRRASTFEDETGKKLFPVKGKRCLFADMDGDVVPIYALATSVTLRPDPHALPPLAEMSAGVIDTAEKHLARMLARNLS